VLIGANLLSGGEMFGAYRIVRLLRRQPRLPDDARDDRGRDALLVISYWRTRDAIRVYAGDDIRKTRHLPRDVDYLIDPEPTVMNYDLSVLDVGCPR